MSAIQQILLMRPADPPPITAVTIGTVYNQTPIEGQWQGIQFFIDGGTAPYSVVLVNQSGFSRGSFYGVAANSSVTYTAVRGDTVLYLYVTDSAGKVAISGWSSGINVLYLDSGGSISVYFPGAGSAASLSAPASGNPVPTIQWYWCNAGTGGSWNTWVTGQSVTTGAIYSGEHYQFYYSAQNAAGMVYSPVTDIYG